MSTLLALDVAILPLPDVGQRAIELSAGLPSEHADRLRLDAEHLPHITLGPADTPPVIAPFSFEATTVAACHLGRFCTCRRPLRTWTLA